MNDDIDNNGQNFNNNYNIDIHNNDNKIVITTII